MDIFNMNFTGNLTGDATKTVLKDLKRNVYNFTVATNVSENNTMFLPVSYWTKLKDVPEGEEQVEDKLLAKLTKGAFATVFSKNAKLTTTKGDNGNVYQNLTIVAAALKL